MIKKRAKRGPSATAPARAKRPGRKPKLRPASVRRKHLRLDQKKLDLLRERFGVATDQQLVEQIIDEAIADRDLIDATIELGGTVPEIVDIGKGT